MAKPKCTCKPVVGVLGLLLMALGVYFLVWGFMTQTSCLISWGVWCWNAILFYLVGLFSLCIGKMIKVNGCQCDLHY